SHAARTGFPWLHGPFTFEEIATLFEPHARHRTSVRRQTGRGSPPEARHPRSLGGSPGRDLRGLFEGERIGLCRSPMRPRARAILAARHALTGEGSTPG